VKGFLLFLVLLAGGVAWSYTHYFSPDARHRRAASAFLAQVHMDELARVAMMAAYRTEQEKGKVTAAEVACMEGMTVVQFNEVLANLLKKKLPRRDIEVATNFYRTPAGEKFSSMILRAIAGRVPSLEMKLEGEEPSLFMEEILELDAYRKSLRSQQSVDPLQLSLDLTLDPDMAELERVQRRKCLPASKA